jgi:hypothetical protein
MTCDSASPDLTRTALAGCQRRAVLAACVVGGRWGIAKADEELPEYRLKAAFIYNFALFTEWPAELGPTLNLCLHDADAFGRDMDALQGKPVGARTVNVLRRTAAQGYQGCQIVFLSAAEIDAGLPRLLEALTGRPVLTIADTPGAARRGVSLNMLVKQGKVVFEANLPSARAAGLNLNAKLLRLATEVIQ